MHCPSLLNPACYGPQAEAIEREKLSAVGLRNQVASLNEVGGCMPLLRPGCTMHHALSNSTPLHRITHHHRWCLQERVQREKELKQLLAERQEELDR